MTKELALYGRDLFGEIVKPTSRGPVADRFTFPPFSVLDAKQGAWQERKRAWTAMGIRGEVGRDALAGGDGTSANSCYTAKRADGSSATVGELHEEGDGNLSSIFDPVVCELAYRWWCPPEGQVVDPFAGGSVRGIVAGALGRKYWGCDLRQEQIDANKAQADEIGVEPRPLWVCGDSMDELEHAPRADFVFSCPPYGDLEKYSDEPGDLSAMEWPTFVAAYKRIILRSVSALKPNRFACFVVGDFRDKRGHYRNFVSQTIDGFEQAGARLYNEAVLATSVGSASMRVTRQFNGGRKLVKTHQNILVFVKGDWRIAARNCEKAAE